MKSEADLLQENETLKFKLRQYAGGTHIKLLQRHNEALTTENKELKAKVKKQAEQIKALRDKRGEVMPDEIKQAKAQIKRERARVQSDARDLKSRIAIDKRISKDEERLLRSVVHPDRMPEHMRERADKAMAILNRALDYGRTAT